MTDRIARAERVILDLGTGDGRAVLARAAASPRDLVIGVDASASAMAEASRRVDRQRVANAIFLAAGAADLPRSVLAGTADLVTITFPWGSLLRGVLGLEPRDLAGVAAILAAGGTVEALVSVVPEDGIPGIPSMCRDHEPAIRAAWAAAGLDLTAVEPADAAVVAASGSSWARRLRAGGPARPVWRLAGG